MKVLRISKNTDDLFSIRVHPSLLENKQVTAIAFGAKTIPCEFEFDDTLEDEIKIGEILWADLLIPYETKLHVIAHEDTLHLGPVIGVFTAGFTDSMLRPIGDRSVFFSKILSVQESTNCIAYVFGAQSINWTDGTVEGYFFDEDGWSTKILPLPQVVYDRLPNRKTEQHRALQRIKDRLTNEYLIPWFNPGFFNKWDVYQILKDIDGLKEYLPITIETPSVEDVQNLLNIFPFVYLKPMNGSLGHGILKCWYQADEHAYYVRYREEEENYIRKYDQLETLLTNTLQERTLATYIVQQGISLIREGNGSIDFRVHTNKDQRGNWHVTAIAAKVAGKGSPTTHVKSGGYIKVLDELHFSEELKYEWAEKLYHAALSISQTIDEKMPGYIGEIGFDLGIDRDGRVWLFEANSKPGRSIFSHPRLHESDVITREYSFLYGLYLMEKSIQSPEELMKS